MTNTETVGTERLEEIRALTGGESVPHYEAAAMARELLASRTQSPAEWQVEAAARAIIEDRNGGVCNVTDWRETEWNPAVANAIHEARLALRAASIPAPERSKEETGVRVKPLEWRKENGLRKWTAMRHFGWYEILWSDLSADKTPYGLFDEGNWRWFATLEEAKAAAQADYEQRIKSALETPPLHKEGEAVAWRSVPTKPTDQMYVAFREALDDHAHIYRFVEAYEAMIAAAPVSVPVPVTITITDVFSAEEAMLIQYRDEYCQGDDPIKKHAWTVADARLSEVRILHRKLTAALSAKPGEQG